MTLTPLTEQLRDFGARYARAGNPKPDFATWSLTYGAGDQAVRAHRDFCRGFDAVRSHAWESTKRDLTKRVAISMPSRMRVAVPA
jgi:hypothetical protein